MNPIAVLRRDVYENAMTGFLLVYVMLCIILGGSGRDGLYAHGVLQAIASAGIAVIVFTWPKSKKMSPLMGPLVVLGAFVIIGLVQLIPFPEVFWRALPGRGIVVDGFGSLGLEGAPMPISLDSEGTFHTILYILPPLFILLLCVRISPSKLVIAIPWATGVFGLISVAWGVAQLYGGRDSHLYLYQFTNNGSPVGFFANANHFACFCLMLFPYGMYLFFDLARIWSQSDRARALCLLAALISGFLVFGVLAAGALSIYCLLLPVLVAIILTYGGSNQSEKKRRFLWVIPICGVSTFIAVILSVPLLEDLGVTKPILESGSRIDIWLITLDAIGSHWLFGTGIGTYQSVIPLYECRESVSGSYIARAHNEYIQLVLEAGVFGGLLITFTLAYFLRTGWQIWTINSNRINLALKKAAFISASVVIIHSLVDYPARTPAISALLAVNVGIMISRSEKKNRTSSFSNRDAKRLVL